MCLLIGAHGNQALVLLHLQGRQGAIFLMITFQRDDSLVRRRTSLDYKIGKRQERHLSKGQIKSSPCKFSKVNTLRKEGQGLRVREKSVQSLVS